MARDSADASGYNLYFGKTRNATPPGAFVNVAENDELGQITFGGANEGIYRPGAQITALVDGEPSTGGDTTDMPGRLVFSPTTNGASSPTERMRITSDAYVRLAAGTGGIQFNGDTAAANALDDYEEGTADIATIIGNSTGSRTMSGSYTKIGRLVCCTGSLNVAAFTDSSITDAKLTLPFTRESGRGITGSISVNSLRTGTEAVRPNYGNKVIGVSYNYANDGVMDSPINITVTSYGAAITLTYWFHASV